MAEVFDFGLQEHKIKMDGGFSNNGLFAVVGDTARRLEVQLLNSNNAIQDTTGINLRLNAEVAGKITFVDAVVKDATKGVYTVNLSNGMFLEPGNWAFQWQITKGANKISSFPFAVKIGQNISEGGVQATNFYFNVEELRLKTVELENRYQAMINSTTDKDVISAPEIIVARSGEIDLNARLTKNEQETTAQLAQNAKKIYKQTSPENFGAIGDGVNDDTTSIQSAINFCDGGGVVRLTGKYKITAALVMKKGVTLLGTTDGVFAGNCKILVAIASVSAIKFDSITTGIKMANFHIKPFNDTFKKTFNGIEFTNSEYTQVDNVTIDGALYGYYMTSSVKSNYACRLTNISAINCDIGIYVKKVNSWSNAIYFGLKEVSDNRIGFLAEQGDGNTIEGGSAEVGRNTECGIRINGGIYHIKGALWLENSPIGMEINNATVVLDGDIYAISQIRKGENANIIQNARQLFSNVMQKKFSLNGLVAWFSFDNIDNNVINYVDGVSYPNATYVTENGGAYGHTSKVKNGFGLGLLKTNFNPSSDWTIMLLMKSNIVTESGTPFLTMQNNTLDGYTYFDNNVSSNGNITLTRIRPFGGTNFNVGHENANSKDYIWLTLKYDSVAKKLTSFSSMGNEVAPNPSGSLNLDNYTDKNGIQFSGGSNFNFDEIVIYNRKIDNDEIRTITNLDTIPIELKVKMLEKKVELLSTP